PTANPSADHARGCGPSSPPRIPRISSSRRPAPSPPCLPCCEPPQTRSAEIRTLRGVKTPAEPTGSRPSSGPVATGLGKDRPGRLVGTEILSRIKLHHFGEPRPGAADPALYRADGAAADLGRLLIGEARGPDQHQGLALVVRQLRQRLAE